MTILITFALAVAVVADAFWLRLLAALVAGGAWLYRRRPRRLPAARRADLRAALEKDALDLRFQPVVDLADGRTAGVEALPRWHHPKLGWLGPAELLRMAAEAGLGPLLGAWVLDRSCRQLARWLADGRDLWITVRAEPAELESVTYVAGVAAALTTHRVPAARLVVEVTGPGDSRQVTSQLAGLRALGVRVCLGGTDLGPATMRQLRRLSVDLVKGSGPATAVVVTLGRRLGYEVVAQDLGTAEALTTAKAAGCRYGQGAVLGRAAPAEHVEPLLEWAATRRAG
ncbi:EAL domain-containing protein [Longispora sp. NPDC051575]|uniref:EAL domain-containing protein n=1 Tax=Longispora sp. NPDC051575 TaxID=3154943 RepID=UPI003420D905